MLHCSEYFNIKSFNCEINVVFLFFFSLLVELAQKNQFMVWCASTLWAETADGYFRQKWKAALERRGIKAALLEDDSRRANSASPQRSDWSSERSNSPVEEDPRKAKAEQERQELLSNLERAAEVHERRAKAVHANRIAALRQQKQIREEKTKNVKKLSDERVEEKVRVAREAIRTREKRFLPVIDQCETREELDTLRAASFHVIIAAHTFVFRGRYEVKVARMVAQLRLLLIPLIHLWRQRRKALARVYAGIWRGKCHRPTVAQLRSATPQFLQWTPAAIQRLIRKMKPMCFLAGKRIFSDGEPGVAALYISSGRVSVKQRRLHATDLELGERGATYLHGEELLTKDTQVKHFTNLIAVEQTYAWFLRRDSFIDLVKDCKSQGDLRTATEVVVAANSSKTEEYVEQAFEHNKKVLQGWSKEELTAVLEHAKEVNLARGEVLYEDGQRSLSAYLIIRGTILVAERVKRSSAESADTPDTAGGAAPNPIIVATTDGAAPTGDGAQASSSRPYGLSVDIESDEFAREYANVGQLVGEEHPLFNSLRSGFAVAATDSILLDIPHTAFMNGMFSDPRQLCVVKDHFNRVRCGRLLPPLQSELSKHLNAALVPFFMRAMTPNVISRGEQLPLKSHVVYLQSGRIQMEGITFKAPCILLSQEALKKTVENFEAAMSAGSLELIKPDKDPSRIAAAALQNTLQAGGGRATNSKAAKKLRMSVSQPTALQPGAQDASALSMVSQAASIMTSMTGDGESGEGDDHAGAQAPAAAHDNIGYIPLQGSMTLVVKPPYAREGEVTSEALVKSVVKFRYLPTNTQIQMLVDDLSEGLPVLHKALTRVDAWGVRYLDFIRKFRLGSVSVSRVSDYVSGEQLEKLTPKPESDQ